MIIYILKYLFVFLSGALMGWGLEVVYRRYFGKARRWINPGFLSGPYLPLYGTGLALLYFVSDLSLHIGWKILLFAIITTTIEYITGWLFLKFYRTRLWDYTNVAFNFQGIIAPLYSFYWTLLSLFFYYVLYPYFYMNVQFLYENLEFSLFIGMFYGIVFVDIIHSFNVLNRLKAITDSIEDSKVVIRYEQLKLEIKDKIEKGIDRNAYKEISRKVESLKARKPSFIFPFKGDYGLRQMVKEHIEKRSN